MSVNQGWRTTLALARRGKTLQVEYWDGRWKGDPDIRVGIRHLDTSSFEPSSSESVRFSQSTTVGGDEALQALFVVQ